VERRLPAPGEVVGFVNRHRIKAAAGIAGGGLASAPFLDGKIDKIVAGVGAFSFCYVVVKGLRAWDARVDRRRNGSENK
jgi:hypothetical protein